MALVIAGFLAAGKISQPASESASSRVDKEFAEWDRKDAPGCSVAASRNGVILYERGYGMANLELGVRITPASRFMVASISKPMTAMSILLLAEAGKLSIDDEVQKYVPNFRFMGDGLRSGTCSAIQAAFAMHICFANSRIRSMKPLIVSTPWCGCSAGRKASTSSRALNFNTTMARTRCLPISSGALAASRSALSRRPNIFKPLGMTHTRFHDHPAMLEPNRATGYHRTGNSWTIPVHSDLGRIVGNSGLFTTAGDLLLWQQNFAEQRVGSPAALAAMQTAATLSGGATSPYGLGVFVGKYRGLRTISHSGGDPGYAANLVRYSDRGLGIAILCNFDDPPLGRMTDDFADIFLGDAPENRAAPEVGPDVKIVQLTTEELALRAGVYRDSQTDTFSRLYVRDGKLMTEAAGDTFELTPTSANLFILSGTSIALEFTGDRELHIVGFGPKPTVVQKVDPLKLSASELNTYAGQYTNAEVEATFTMAAADSKLVLRRHARPDIVLDPVYPDTFQANLVGLMKFSRDAAGKVTGFSIKTDGVRNIRFERMP